MKKTFNLRLLPFAALLAACLAGPAQAQSTHAFNSGMNCCGVWTLPDTSTHPYRATAGDDADYQPAISSPSYTDNGNGTVTDNVTRLMWVRNPGSTGYTWGNALSSCTATTAGGMNYGTGFAGYTDWRLPNVRELMSIVDYGAVTPSISISVFPGTVAGRYWTSTSYGPAAASAWYVTFNNGAVSTNAKTNSATYVRCVRGGP